MHEVLLLAVDAVKAPPESVHYTHPNPLPLYL